MSSVQMTGIILDECHYCPSVASGPVFSPVVEIVTPEELFDTESQTVNTQEVTIAGRESIGQAGAPAHDVQPDLESAHPPLQGQEAEDGGHGPTRATLNRSKLATTRLMVLIVAVLSLTVVPGLVLGVVTKQIPVGIALAGASATVVSVFAGIYYYHNK